MIRTILSLLFAMPAYAQVGPIPYSALGKLGGPALLDGAGIVTSNGFVTSGSLAAAFGARIGAQIIGSTGYSWLEPIVPNSESSATTGLVSINRVGGAAGIFASRSSDTTVIGQLTTLQVYPINDNAGHTLGGLYIEPHGLAPFIAILGSEIGITSTQTAVATDPYSTQPNGVSIAYRTSAGKQSGDSNVSTGYDCIKGLTAKFGHCLVIGDGSVATGAYGAEAVVMGQGQGVGWYAKAGTLAGMIRSDADSTFTGHPNRIVFDNTKINFQTPNDIISLSIGNNGVQMTNTTINGSLRIQPPAGPYGSEALILTQAQSVAWYGNATTQSAIIRSDADSTFTGHPNRIVFDNTKINFQTPNDIISASISNAGVQTVSATINGTLTALGAIVASGPIVVSGLPTCASAPASGYICRDTTTTPATLKVIP